MDDDIMQEGVNSTGHAVLDPSSPPLGGMDVFHTSTGCCLPHSVDMIHDLKACGGVAPCQDPICDGNLLIKADINNAELDRWADCDAKSAMVLLSLLTGRVVMRAASASCRMIASPLRRAPAIFVLDLAARHLVQCTVTELSENTKMDRNHSQDMQIHTPTCSSSATNLRTEFMTVPLGFLLEITLFTTSAGNIMRHTTGGDVPKVEKMQPPAPSAAASQYPAT
eukprot:15359605-Ditylum_brightwellii.AAC.2